MFLYNPNISEYFRIFPNISESKFFLFRISGKPCKGFNIQFHTVCFATPPPPKGVYGKFSHFFKFH